MILHIIISNGILDLVTGILAKISLGTGIWYPPSRLSLLFFTVRHVFVEFVEGRESGIRNPESGIRNAEFATLFLLLFVENHFAFTIFFCISFFKVIEYCK